MSLAVWHLATKNPHKAAEFAELLRGLAIEIRPLPAAVPECPESARSFEANALEKAVFYGRYVGGWVLADDSGLCVDALGGAPGVESARYAGVHGDDAANNAKLLAALSGVPEDGRGARFVCALALWNASLARGVVVRGEVSGVIAAQPRGQHGFGYDPLFCIPQLRRTFAELTPAEKNRWSHRARAAAALMRAWRGQADEDLPGQ
ncbi:MAG: RdgB/HAM1 family non-canonical purine NTP pyrophosphatase [Alicyclobacillus sp.]|nr:RdgB/HAM1 family non-canonical purine NTP pyrophosphatase [Alicyclobacillus sp.]